MEKSKIGEVHSRTPGVVSLSSAECCRCRDAEEEEEYDNDNGNEYEPANPIDT